MSAEKTEICIGAFGSAEFGRRTFLTLVGEEVAPLAKNQQQIFRGALNELLSLGLTERPQLIIIEIGFNYNAALHRFVKKSLLTLRERLEGLYVAVALTAPEKFFFGGDLLFQDDTTAPSALVDTFAVIPGVSSTALPSLSEQILDIVELGKFELQRRALGAIPTPALSTNGWVQSLADPKSRALWMRWLPRYASYTNENPLIVGETGTGKTNLAYALHRFSGRKGEFISITPRDFSSSELVQAELFGALAGAYTGAVDKWGLVKSAERGTLFIDELQSIDKELQGKLITFIENKIYRRVGGTERTTADVRFVFASNRSLNDLMDGVLRDDFAYRLERVQLQLLPLRERRLDIGAALASAIAKIKRLRPYQTNLEGFTANAYNLLLSYPWPGNLRQLENVVAQLCELSDMSGKHLIDESAVEEILGTRISGPGLGAAEVLALAASRLETMAATLPNINPSAASACLQNLLRAASLEACAGRELDAAKLVDDDPAIMALFASHLSR